MPGQSQIPTWAVSGINADLKRRGLTPLVGLENPRVNQTESSTDSSKGWRDPFSGPSKTIKNPLKDGRKWRECPSPRFAPPETDGPKPSLAGPMVYLVIHCSTFSHDGGKPLRSRSRHCIGSPSPVLSYEMGQGARRTASGYHCFAVF